MGLVQLIKFIHTKIANDRLSGRALERRYQRAWWSRLTDNTGNVLHFSFIPVSRLCT